MTLEDFARAVRARYPGRHVRISIFEEGGLVSLVRLQGEETEKLVLWDRDETMDQALARLDKKL